MDRFTLIQRNLSYHWRTNAAVVFGVATAVAVLAGALLVGDSVRGSLRDLVLGRIGKTDYVIAAVNPFRAALASEMGNGAYAMFAMEGIVTHGSNKRAASKVAIYGVDEGFWKFHGVALSKDAPSGRNALVSGPLAQELQIQPGDAIVLRLDKPSEIPAESVHGRKEDAVKAVRLAASAVLSSEELGEFALKPTQAGVRAVFVSLPRLQRELAQAGKANVMLIAGNAPDEQFRQKAILADYGIRVKPVVERGELSVETASMVINDALAKATEAAAAETKSTASPVLTYLVNSLRHEGREVPYSLVTALDLTAFGVKDGMVVNDWAARELGVKPGGTVTLEFYVWKTEGVLSTQKTELAVTAITPIRGIAADRDFVPEYPGITEAKTITEWDPPFPMDLGKIRQQDEDYWDKYRTTPKAYIGIEEGKKLWGTRYGNLTSIRVRPPQGTDLEQARAAMETALRNHLKPADMDVAIVAIRRDSLTASAGSTDFGEYFLYFSFFLVVSALLLVSLFFKLGVEQRYREAGLLRAVGFPVEQIGKLFLIEGAMLATVGSLVGALAAAAYAALILYGLRTWWVDAVGTRLLQLHLGILSTLGGVLGGLLTAVLVIYFAARSLRKPSPRALLQGNTETKETVAHRTRAKWIAIVFAVLGLAMLGAGGSGGFFGAGAMLLIAALAAERMWLGSGVTGTSSVWRLGVRNATYRPGRSVLSASLIASATFLIVSLTAFRQEGASMDPAKRPGTGGYALVGESALPVIYNPGAAAGRAELGFPTAAEKLFQGVKVMPLRLRPGDDSSCLNLYQPRNPRVLGVPDEVLFRMPLSKEKLAPQQGEMSAYVDANSLQYVLHKKVGDVIVLEPESGSPVRLRISATIQDSMFQSEVLIRETDFLRAFPEQQGFRMFLVEAPAEKVNEVLAMMEDRLQDFGLDLQSTVERLNEYHRVENAYLSTFQALGGLGLLLGTVGLAAVLLRNVLERRKELALLRAVGYQPGMIGKLVLAENVLLLATGLGVGTVCAALAIAPALAERAGKLPLGSILLMLAAVAVTGLASSALAVRAATRSPLLASLRSE